MGKYVLGPVNNCTFSLPILRMFLWSCAVSRLPSDSVWYERQCNVEMRDTANQPVTLLYNSFEAVPYIGSVMAIVATKSTLPNFFLRSIFCVLCKQFTLHTMSWSRKTMTSRDSFWNKRKYVQRCMSVKASIKQCKYSFHSGWKRERNRRKYIWVSISWQTTPNTVCYLEMLLWSGVTPHHVSTGWSTGLAGLRESIFPYILENELSWHCCEHVKVSVSVGHLGFNPFWAIFIFDN